ncbi:hypothetical protein EDC04DRAFT_2613357 [Pisolithus marmoratus]|nr:hypothetical protein EDC04DRAFT_2613357 [Pisolithus marmoratus]
MDARSTTPQSQPASWHPMEYKTEFHPCSNWPTLFQSFNEFHVSTKKFTPPTDDAPYHLFHTAGDFEFVEVALAAGLNQVQVDKLLDLISHVSKGTAQVTLKNNMELCTACEAAAAELTPIRNSDPHTAISFDHLHASHDGVGGRHVLHDMKIILHALGCDTEAEVENYIFKFPRWHGLSHFKSAINVTFSDGNKKHDLVKEMFYACLNVFTKNSTPEGYQLLHVLTSYLELDKRTIGEIEVELLGFDRALKGYIECVEKSEAYECQSNSRAIASQILWVEEHMLAVKLLRMHIDHHMNWSELQA